MWSSGRVSAARSSPAASPRPAEGARARARPAVPARVVRAHAAGVPTGVLGPGRGPARPVRALELQAPRRALRQRARRRLVDLRQRPAAPATRDGDWWPAGVGELATGVCDRVRDVLTPRPYPHVAPKATALDEVAARRGLADPSAAARGAVRGPGWPDRSPAHRAASRSVHGDVPRVTCRRAASAFSAATTARRTRSTSTTWRRRRRTAPSCGRAARCARSSSSTARRYRVGYRQHSCPTRRRPGQLLDPIATTSVVR